MPKFTFIDLFAGLGGFRIALEELGGQCVFSSDNDKSVQKVYEDNFGEKPHGDITLIAEKDIPNHDILCAGFPCQPFSIAGHRKGFMDTRGTLFFDVERIIKEKNPKAFILENVKGLTNHDGGRTFDTILRKLASSINGEVVDYGDNLGYHVFYKVLNSKDYNVPQNRERIYIIGIKSDIIPEYIFPEAVKLTKNLKSIFNSPTLDHRVNSLVASHILDNLEYKKDRHSLGKEKPLVAYEIRPSKCTFRQDGISPCLTAKMGTGGNNVPVYVQEMRKFSISECLAIQGFPSDYKIPLTGMQSYKQIGNSVSVPVVKAVAKPLLKAINL